jgi:hypothetical protein
MALVRKPSAFNDVYNSYRQPGDEVHQLFVNIKLIITFLHKQSKHFWVANGDVVEEAIHGFSSLPLWEEPELGFHHPSPVLFLRTSHCSLVPFTGPSFPGKTVSFLDRQL